MKWKLNKDESDQPIDEQIILVLNEMTTVGVIAPEYPMYIAYLERLSAIKAKRRKDPISRDMMAQVLGNLAGIFIIVAYEQKHVITSRAFGELMRAKT